MKKFFLPAFSALLLIIFTTPLFADNSSIEMGKKFFNDPTLSGSTNNRTCNSCHHNGDGLQDSKDIPKLMEIINRCILGPLNGKKLDHDSVEMLSLVKYIQTIGKSDQEHQY